jgi:asparagine synthase (glutamine-hydrolysing)
MCGIVGFHGLGSQSDLETMRNAIAHRGPDGHREHIDPGNQLHLGFSRLAVIDIDGGSQPMWNETKDIAVIFNGEIYNHAELRTTLENDGHKF